MGKIKQENKKKKKVKMTCGKEGKWGEVSPTFDACKNENQKGRKEQEKEK